MQIEMIRLKNFRAFQSVTMKNIPRFCVLIGANGTGKSTLFAALGFLRDALATNVSAALGKLGGSRGFQEVRSRNSTGPIEFEIKFRAALGKSGTKLITYELHIDERHGRPIIVLERLQYRRGNKGGKPWRFLNFANGEGEAVINELDGVQDET